MALSKQEAKDLIYVWELLEILTVSIDRIGSYQALRGTEAGKEALSEFIKPEITRKIARSRGILTELLEGADPDMSDLLDNYADKIKYWGDD